MKCEFNVTKIHIGCHLYGFLQLVGTVIILQVPPPHAFQTALSHIGKRKVGIHQFSRLSPSLGFLLLIFRGGGGPFSKNIQTTTCYVLFGYFDNTVQILGSEHFTGSNLSVFT